MHKAHGRHDDAPENHDDGNEDGWSETLEQNLGQRLEASIGDEENGEGQVILRACQFQIFAQASDFGIADVGTVEEGGEVQETEPWYQLQVEFPQECAVLEYHQRMNEGSRAGVGTILARS